MPSSCGLLTSVPDSGEHPSSLLLCYPLSLIRGIGPATESKDAEQGFSHVALFIRVRADSPPQECECTLIAHHRSVGGKMEIPFPSTLYFLSECP